MLHLLDALILSAVAVLPRAPVFSVAARFAGDTAPNGRGQSRAGSIAALTVTQISPD